MPRLKRAMRFASISQTARSIMRASEFSFPKMPESVRKILELGGLANYLKTQLPVV